MKAGKLAFVPHHSLAIRYNITQPLSAISTAAMPATTAALAKLQQRFTTPSIEEIQKYSPCAICWADYDEGIMSDTPIKLRCRHVFGEKCILKWAKGKTPSGYRNGCPFCHADLLPQSLWTNLCSWVFSKLENFFTTYPPTDEIYGGTSDVVLGLLVILIGILVASDRLLGTSTAHGSTLSQCALRIARLESQHRPSLS